MKNFIRRTRLVYACINLAGGVFRLLGALVGMAFNYLDQHGSDVAQSI